MTLQFPKFVEYDQEGQLSVLRCKICGTVIGERAERSHGFKRLPDGRMIERISDQFHRNNLYCEIKIAFEDGSAHVTNGCKNCLVGLTDGAILSELEQADMLEQKLKPRTAIVAEVVEVKAGGGIA